MTTGINVWGDLLNASLKFVQTGIHTSEMLSASGTVIGSRMGTMAAAARNPWSGDYAELHRIIPEKFNAFSDAGAAILEHWSPLMLQSVRQVQNLSSTLLAGRVPELDELCDLAAGTVAYGSAIVTTALNAGSIALAPIHQAATGNARRLCPASS